MLNRRIIPILIALTSFNVNVQASDGYYMGISGGSSSQKYDDINFINPRITGMASGNGDESGNYWSIKTGKKIDEQPYRVELEYSDHGEETFTSYWNPFVANFQKVTVDSKSLMINAIYDHDVGFGTIFVGGGVGVSKNVATAEQQTSGNFAENTERNLAASFIVGASTPISDIVDIELMYKYSDLGDANTGISQFAPNDEQFTGKLKTSEIGAGLKVKF